MMKKITLPLILLLTFSNTSIAKETYSIGILAKRGVNAGFYEKWLLHGAYLEEKTRLRFDIKPLLFAEVEQAVSEGKVDFLLVNSSMFARYKVKYGVEAIGKMINKSAIGGSVNSFGGVIFTSKASSGINSLRDVKGKTFIAVKKTSFGGYKMALKEFLDNGIKLSATVSDTVFEKSHDNVVKQVFARPGTIGTVRTDTLERMAFDGLIDLNDVKIINRKNQKTSLFLSAQGYIQSGQWQN